MGSVILPASVPGTVYVKQRAHHGCQVQAAFTREPYKHETKETVSLASEAYTFARGIIITMGVGSLPTPQTRCYRFVLSGTKRTEIPQPRPSHSHTRIVLS